MSFTYLCKKSIQSLYAYMYTIMSMYFYIYILETICL